MLDTSEKNFEASIEAALLAYGPDDPAGGDQQAAYGAAKGWARRKPEEYDRDRCVVARDLFDFIYATQPKMWAKLTTQHGEQHVRERFLRRLTSELEARGTLDVLRKGVVDYGCAFDLVYPRPETTLNAEHQQLYIANILSIVRQLRYSRKNDNSLDLVLFVNGLPVITAELKNSFKGQTVADAVQQYRNDRDPKEPLLAFGRCLAHFAVDPDQVFMTTHLRGPDTRFLPFNQGTEDGGAGNPVNPLGFRTAYLWEDTWQRDTLLDIVSHFSQVEDVLDDKGKPTGARQMVFPRYHQHLAVRKMIEHARRHGAGHGYLIQHSAGSGKSNTIAWLAHRLAGLHADANTRVFDTTIVVTDRRNLDQQLRGTIRSFEQVRGLVTAIEHDKSSELAKALEEGAQIIVTTLQTFPFVVTKLGALAGKRFAVIIDEAHSSQSGEGASSLKQVLAGAQQPDEDASDEDAINAVVEQTMQARGRLANVSFFAFTATPKGKTLELFGTKQPDGAYRPFSLYSMRQAIEEGFILDVLQNYTTYKVYFGLLKKIENDPQYDKRQATALLRGYVDLHEHAIREKTELIVEHFHGQVRHRIPDANNLGRAKAMIVTRSRLSAVRYKLSFERHLKAKGYPYKALVAFSGEVTDPDTGLEYTEPKMNGVPESATADTFKGSEYRFLIVAEKFQTGFDQPFLQTMYVDKKLGGVNAVQTLSRLNRTHPDKTDTFVLDFANDAEEIQAAFQPFYETTLLSEATDPNKLYDLKRILEDYHLFGMSDVETFAKVYWSQNGKNGQARLNPVIDQVVDRYRERETEQKVDFRKHLDDYVRLYAFLGQILTFTDTDLEKLYQFARHLARKLPLDRIELPADVVRNINMESYRIQQTSSGEIRLIAEDGQLKPIGDLGTGRPTEQDLTPLSEILKYINEHFGTEFTEEDKVAFFADDMQRRLLQQDGLRLSFDPKINKSEENRRLAFYAHFNDLLHEMMGANRALYTKIVDDPEFGAVFKEYMFRTYSHTIQHA